MGKEVYRMQTVEMRSSTNDAYISTYDKAGCDGDHRSNLLFTKKRKTINKCRGVDGRKTVAHEERQHSLN